MPETPKDKFLNLTGLQYLIGKLDEKYKPINYYAIKTINYPNSGSFSATSTDETLSLLATTPIVITRTTDTHQLTWSHANSGVTIPSGQSTATFPGSASNSPTSIAFNGTFTVPTFTVNAMGHITSAGTTTYKIPQNPGHYEAYLITGASNAAKANAAVSSGNVYLNLVENNTVRNAHKLIGTNITITCSADGDITFAGTTDTLGKNIVGASASATANALATDGNVYLNHIEGSNTLKSHHNIIGLANSSTSVVSDADGNITIGGPVIGTCSTSPGVNIKSVSISGFVLRTGAIARIKFTNANTSSNPKLDINSTGEKPIFFQGAAITTADWNLLGPQSNYVTFVYDGTNYEIADNPQTISLRHAETELGTIPEGGTDPLLDTNTNFYLTFTNGRRESNSRNRGLFSTYRARFLIKTGTTAEVGSATIVLGNSTSKGTAQNAIGSIVLYGENDKFVQLRARPDMAGGCYLKFPRATDSTLVAAPHTVDSNTDAYDSTVGSATQPVYINDKGVVNACQYTLGASVNKEVPSNALFTDENVKSTAAATTKLYLVGSSSSGTATGSLSKDTNVYLTTTSGELYAQKFQTTSLKMPGITSGTTVSVTAIAKSTDSSTDNDTTLVTAGYVKDLIGGVTQISYQVLGANENLPTTGAAGVIYLKPAASGGDYEEWIWIDGNPGKYEQIGRTAADLSGYWTEAELVAITTTEIAALFPSAS